MLKFIAYLSLVTLTMHARDTTPKGEWLNTCTAVYVSPNTALTAGHCVESNTSGKIWVKTDHNKSFSAKLVLADHRIDLALIKTDGPPHKYVRLAKHVVKGQPIYLISSEEDMIGTYAEGIVENILPDDDCNGTTMIYHSAAIKPGASGSGLFDRKGHLVGINTKSWGPITLAVDLDTVRRFLAAANTLL